MCCNLKWHSLPGRYKCKVQGQIAFKWSSMPGKKSVKCIALFASQLFLYIINEEICILSPPGVMHAVNNVNKVIAPALIGKVQYLPFLHHCHENHKYPPLPQFYPQVTRVQCSHSCHWCSLSFCITTWIHRSVALALRSELAQEPSSKSLTLLFDNRKFTLST